MDIHEFLAGIRSHQESQQTVPGTNGPREISSLTYDYGIYDNFTILAAAPSSLIVQAIENHALPAFAIEKRQAGGVYTSERVEAAYVPGTAQLFIYPETTQQTADPLLTDFLRTHYQSQLEFHQWQQKRMPDTTPTRAIADAVDVICSYLLKKEVQFCIPSYPWKLQYSSQQPQLADRMLWHPNRPDITAALRTS